MTVRSEHPGPPSPKLLWRGLFAERAVDVDTSLDGALRTDHERRRSALAELLGPLRLPDTRFSELARLTRNFPPLDRLPVCVLNTSGAGGLVALARRTPEFTDSMVQVVAVESSLRDLDDLTGNAARVVAAAAELDESVEVYVGLPHAPGWASAAAELEAAGLSAHLRLSALDPESSADHAHTAAGHLAEQLSTLIELDLPFTVGLGSGRPDVPGLLVAVDMLIDSADPSAAAAVLAGGSAPAGGSFSDRVRGWADASATRIRRRLRGVDVPDLAALIDDLDERGLPAFAPERASS